MTKIIAKLKAQVRMYVCMYIYMEREQEKGVVAKSTGIFLSAITRIYEHSIAILTVIEGKLQN